MILRSNNRKSKFLKFPNMYVAGLLVCGKKKMQLNDLQILSQCIYKVFFLDKQNNMG